MDKKILILKNDRVGDFFHSLRNIEHLRNHFSDHITDIYLSEINIRFASVLSQDKLNIIKVNYNLSFIEKFKKVLNLQICLFQYSSSTNMRDSLSSSH